MAEHTESKAGIAATRSLTARRLVPAMLAAAFLFGLAGRMVSGWSLPLSFDETFSGTIASQPNLAGLVHWCLNELSGPAFYMPLWGWTRFAGDSNVALRLPSFLLSLAAPLLIAWRGHRDRDLRYFWAALALLWLPGLSMAPYARPYAQLFFLGTAQAMAFLRMAETPSTGRALLWTSLSGLMVLTHYYAAPVCAVQGLAYLAFRRKAAVATWPALLALVPVAAWMAVHLPMVLDFARVSGGHYVLLGAGDLSLLPTMLFGSVVHGLLILGIIGTTLVMQRNDLRTARLGAAEPLLAASGILAFLCVFALAFFRPSFAPRYLTPALPAVLFAVALWARYMLRRDWRPVALVFGLLFLVAGFMIGERMTGRVEDDRAAANLEEPSRWIMERPVGRLVFFWDSVIGGYGDAGGIKDLAGFLFRRAGHPVAVQVVRVGLDADPNAAVLAAATGPGTAILWRTTDVMLDPRFASRRADIARRDPRFECRSFGPAITACRPR
jgi:hypothetical protein